MTRIDATVPSAIPPVPLGVTVGRNVRRIRSLRGLSLTELARAADVSRARLTELEGGRANPTLDTVAALAGILGVPAAELLADVTGGEPLVVRADAGRVLVRQTVRFRLLHRLEAGHAVIETWQARLTAGRHEAGPMPVGTLLHAYVATGAATLGPVAAPVDVGPGDAVLYRADVPAVFGCPMEAVLSLTVLYPPSGAPEALSSALGGR